MSAVLFSVSDFAPVTAGSHEIVAAASVPARFVMVAEAEVSVVVPLFVRGAVRPFVTSAASAETSTPDVVKFVEFSVSVPA